MVLPQKPARPQPRKRQRTSARTVLDPSSYTSALTHLITRDFFPALAHRQPELGSTSSSTAPLVHSLNKISVNEFQRDFISSNTRAFNTMMQEEHRIKKNRTFGREDEEKEKDAGGRRRVGWKYRRENLLSYRGDTSAARKKPQDLIVDGNKKRKVDSSATRFGNQDAEDAEILQAALEMKEGGNEAHEVETLEEERRQYGSSRSGFRIQKDSMKGRIERRLRSEVLRKKRRLRKGEERELTVRIGATPLRMSKAAYRLARQQGMSPVVISRSASATPRFLTPRLSPQLE